MLSVTRRQCQRKKKSLYLAFLTLFFCTYSLLVPAGGSISGWMHLCFGQFSRSFVLFSLFSDQQAKSLREIMKFGFHRGELIHLSKSFAPSVNCWFWRHFKSHCYPAGFGAKKGITGRADSNCTITTTRRSARSCVWHRTNPRISLAERHTFSEKILLLMADPPYASSAKVAHITSHHSLEQHGLTSQLDVTSNPVWGEDQMTSSGPFQPEWPWL